MTNRRLSWLLLTLVILLLSACTAVTPQAAAPATGAEAAPAPGEQATITWAFWGEPNERASHERVAAAFMAEHPEINIEIWHQPWSDYFTQIQALWSSGDSALIPDIAFLWPTPQYAAQGVLENLDTYILENDYDLEDYWPGLLESGSYEGSVYGLPRDIEVNVLYYNKDIFDEAGVAYPTDDWSWDDLRAAAEQLTVKDAGGNTERYALAMEGSKAGKFILQNRGAILNDLRNPSACALASPESIEALQFYADLLSNGYVMPPADLNQAGGDAGVFQSGQAAMIIQNTSRVSGFNAAGMNYDVAPVPTPEGGRRFNSAGGAAWVMSAASDNKDAAWTFLEWLQSSEGGQRDYTEAGEIFPALQSVANSPSFLTEAPPANKQGIITEAGASGIGGFGYFPEWGEIEGSIYFPMFDLIGAGEGSVEQIAADTCAGIDAFLAENGYPR